MFKKFISILILLNFVFNNCVLAIDTKYPDFGNVFLGEDKWESFNRKMFNFNQKLNKFAIRPVHILWSSIVPEYGMDRLNGISNNIEYPIRFVSSFIQRDFKNCKDETVRFVTNTVLGLGGMFDPAKHLFKIEQSKENMEQALAKCKCGSGRYFVAPVISFTNFRDIFGRLLDVAFNPTSYIGTPILAAVKAGLTVNRTSYIQPLLYMVESTYADPYEIMKKAFGINSYINHKNMDRVDVKSKLYVQVKDESNSQIITSAQNIRPPKPPQKPRKWFEKNVESEIVPDTFYIDLEERSDDKLYADIILPKYNPQSPVVDSMRTALFNIPEVDKSIWNELSIWNRSFGKRIKTASIKFAEGRENYNYKYIMQRERQGSPLAIIYPSIGEGIGSSHSVLFAKLFYDAGYSVVIQGSCFQWEFVKSMPAGYYPGLPANDADALRQATSKIIADLERKFNCKFGDKIIAGTSFGALTALFVGAKESEDNTLGNTRYISICPPPDLVYALRQVDKNMLEWEQSSEELKQKAALAAAKVVKLYQSKDDIKHEINNLPFDDEEGKLITGFIMHQKLSDLVFTIESADKKNASEFYNYVNNMGYEDYAEKYLVSNEGETCDSLAYRTSLASIADYLRNADNYKIYHSLNDYLTNIEQLKNLKHFTGDKTIIVDNGSHLGFLYRKEFLEHLKKVISAG